MGTKVGRDLCKPQVKQIVFQTINIVLFISFNSSVLCSTVDFISFSVSKAVSKRFCSPQDSSLVLLQGHLASLVSFSFPFCFGFGAGDISGGTQVGFALGLGYKCGEKCQGFHPVTATRTGG